MKFPNIFSSELQVTSRAADESSPPRPNYPSGSPSDPQPLPTMNPSPDADSGFAPEAPVNKKLKVVVTGAGGRTGSILLEKMLKDPSGMFEPYGIVRSEAARAKAAATGIPPQSLIPCDVSGPDATRRLADAFRGKDAVILATSSVPRLLAFSLVNVAFKKLTQIFTGDTSPAIPAFEYDAGSRPETVDWVGARQQIDAAKEAGVPRFIFIGSMGGTDPENFLNKLGGGNVLLWKRKAEQYLIASGLDYTIIHPGGLLDAPGGQRELLVGVDDTLQKSPNKKVPRADVAEFCIQALLLPSASRRAFDLSSREGAPAAGKAPPRMTADFDALLRSLPGNCSYDVNKQPEDWAQLPPGEPGRIVSDVAAEGKVPENTKF